MNAMSDLVGNRYIDVTKSITVGVPGGPYSGLSNSTFNRKIWTGLSEAHRAAALKASARMAAESVMAGFEFDQAAYEAARKKGIPITQA